MDRINMESALITAYEYSGDIRSAIDRYLAEKNIDEELSIERCFFWLSEAEVTELFTKTFN